MTDVKYRPDEWERAKKALEELSESSGVFISKNKIVGYIEDIHENMEEAGDDIRKLDSDGVISFNYEDTTGKFRELLEDFGVLQDFTGKVGDAVDRAIDQPFYKAMDAFATAMRNLSIENYTTKNTIGATEVKVTYTGGYGVHAYKTTERKKDTINMIDILNGNNFYAAKIKVDYDRFKQEHPDEKFSFEDYQHAALNTRAFQYESIEDNQKKKEFWRDIIIGIGLVVGTVAAIACPPAAPAIIALGATYGTLELGSAISGKDWMTGRELDTGERWLRGAFSLLDIVPGVKGVHAFTKAARGVPEAVLKVAKQSATNLKTAVKQGATTVQGLLNTAAMKALERVRAVKESARESARIALKRAEPGMIKTAQKADEFYTNVKNLGYSLQERLVPVEGFIPAAENTHRVENFMKSMINKLEDKLSPPPRNVVGGVEGADALKEQIRKRVLENIETSKTAREASNYGVYLRKEKELLAKVEKKALEGMGEGLKVPQGLTQAQFEKVSSMIQDKVGHISDDIVVQGSRAKGTAKPTSDIDIAIRVPADKFDELIQSSFSKVKPPNPGSAKEKTMLHAIETGKIQSGEAKLSKFREQLQQELGMDVDISIIKIGGPFDNPPFTPLK